MIQIFFTQIVEIHTLKNKVQIIMLIGQCKKDVTPVR